MKETLLFIPTFLLKHYKLLTLSEVEMMLILHLKTFFEEGNDFPTPEELGERMTVSASECMNIIRSLIQKGCLEIQQYQNENGMICEKYCLDLLWEKLDQRLEVSKMHILMQQKQEVEATVFEIFEQEFGRLLSPMEYETIQKWMDEDKLDSQLILAALRESVISGKQNFRYIDRILFDWMKNGVRTVDQAKQHSLKFKERTTAFAKQPELLSTQEVQSPKPPIFYDWLDDE